MLGKRFLVVPLLTLGLVLPSLGAGTSNQYGKENAPAAAPKPAAPAAKPPAPAPKPNPPPKTPPGNGQANTNPLPPNPPQPYGPQPFNSQQQAAVFLQAVWLSTLPFYAQMGMQRPQLPINTPSAPDASANQQEMVLKVSTAVSVTANMTKPGGGSAYKPGTFDMVDQDQDVTLILKPQAGAAVNGNGWRVLGKVISKEDKQLTAMVKLDPSQGKIDPDKVIIVSITITTPIAPPAK